MLYASWPLPLERSCLGLGVANMLGDSGGTVFLWSKFVLLTDTDVLEICNTVPFPSLASIQQRRLHLTLYSHACILNFEFSWAEVSWLKLHDLVSEQMSRESILDFELSWAEASWLHDPCFWTNVSWKTFHDLLHDFCIWTESSWMKVNMPLMSCTSWQALRQPCI